MTSTAVSSSCGKPDPCDRRDQGYERYARGHRGAGAATTRDRRPARFVRGGGAATRLVGLVRGVPGVPAAGQSRGRRRGGRRHVHGRGEGRGGRPTVTEEPSHRSSTTSLSGREQHTSTSPRA